MSTEKKLQCNCLRESEERLSDFVKEELVKKNKIHESSETNGRYVNTAFMFGGDISRKPFMSFELDYTEKKKDGSAGNRKTAKQTVTTSFCPFCGEKYPDPQTP